MALAFVRSASVVNQMTDAAFFANYGETSRIVEFFSEPPDAVAGRIFDLHMRHAAVVCRVFDQATASHAQELRAASLPDDCLLSLVISQRDAVRSYLAPTDVFEQAVAIAPSIRMAIDLERRRVLFEQWGAMEGVSAELIIVLLEPFRKAIQNELAPENYPFTSSRDLARRTNCIDNETLRRRVFRCRNRIIRLATSAGDPPPSLDAVIENNPWHGYRLNPDRIRVMARSELRSP
jgi:hypothetical protein